MSIKTESESSSPATDTIISFQPYASSKHTVTTAKYITSNDPRGYIPVFEYPVNNQWIMVDADDGYVLWTGIWKALGNNKSDIVKMIESNPDLGSRLRRIRGGYLRIQGTWMPYDVALRLAKRVAYPIRDDLVPLFGPSFPATCLSPDQEGYGIVVPPVGRKKPRRSMLSVDVIPHKGQPVPFPSVESPGSAPPSRDSPVSSTYRVSSQAQRLARPISFPTVPNVLAGPQTASRSYHLANLEKRPVHSSQNGYGGTGSAEVSRQSTPLPTHPSRSLHHTSSQPSLRTQAYGESLVPSNVMYGVADVSRSLPANRFMPYPRAATMSTGQRPHDPQISYAYGYPQDGNHNLHRTYSQGMRPTLPLHAGYLRTASNPHRNAANILARSQEFAPSRFKTEEGKQDVSATFETRVPPHGIQGWDTSASIINYSSFDRSRVYSPTNLSSEQQMWSGSETQYSYDTNSIPYDDSGSGKTETTTDSPHTPWHTEGREFTTPIVDPSTAQYLSTLKTSPTSAPHSWHQGYYQGMGHAIDLSAQSQVPSGYHPISSQSTNPVHSEHAWAQPLESVPQNTEYHTMVHFTPYPSDGMNPNSFMEMYYQPPPGQQ